jgi:rhamnogalacturonyl hydrolase YesR
MNRKARDLNMRVKLLLCAVFLIVWTSGAALGIDTDNAGEVESVVKRIADHVVDTTKAKGYEWNWGENLLMRGLIRATEVTGSRRYLNFTLDWLDRYCVGSGLYIPTEVDDVASGFSAALAYEKTGKKKYLACTNTAWNYLSKTGPRLPDGTIIHNQSGQLWLDTLYMITPLIARLGKLKNDDSRFDFAAKQIMQNIQRTEDSESYLSYHMWDPVKGHSPHFWARGNGWVVMAVAEVLEVMPESHPMRKDLIDLLNRRLGAIVKLQDATGLWHTVLDRPDSYMEVSASAMYAFAIQRGVRRGWLPESMLGSALKALKAIEPFVQPDGTVLGVSAGTGPGNFESYMKVKTGEYTWGTGATILAFAERIDMLKEKQGK